MTESDAELMARFREGDEDAFRALVRRYQQPLVNFFYRLTWDRHASEDYTQEVFVRLVRSRDSYRPVAKFTTWLFRIARNYWIDRYRERKAAPDVTSLEVPVGGDEGRPLSLRDTVEGRLPEPAGALDSKEIGRRVREAVERLPEDQRLVFVLSENQGLRYAEIAEVMEVPVGTVKSRMHAAVRKLRDLLKDLDHGS